MAHEIFICGVGINDRKGDVDPIYRCWVNMLKRCYDPRYLFYHPTYIGCSVVKEWHLFSNFKEWMETQDWEGKQLDKDLLVPGNKIYGPETCIFVSQSVNKLLTYKKLSRGEYPIGVSRYGVKFQSHVRNNGKSQNLGHYDSELDAHRAWQRAKGKIILDIAEQCNDTRLKFALTAKACNLLIDELHAFETL